MPDVEPIKRPVFRMIHFDNLEYVLTNGMCCKNHPLADPEYINIGDPSLILNRDTCQVKIIPPGGNLGEYVPFYFGGHSPMLLRIKTGRGVKQYPQNEIIYIVCRIEALTQMCKDWCFTDGHAKNAMSGYYNTVEDLTHVDWSAVNMRQWADTAQDWDLARRKQAEFLVKDLVPVCCFAGIIVKSDQRRTQVQEILDRLSLDIKLFVDEKNNYYYP